MENTLEQEFVSEILPKNPLIFAWDKNYTLTEGNLVPERGRNIVIRKELFDLELITEEEFTEKKKALLDSF